MILGANPNEIPGPTAWRTWTHPFGILGGGLVMQWHPVFS